MRTFFLFFLSFFLSFVLSSFLPLLVCYARARVCVCVAFVACVYLFACFHLLSETLCIKVSGGGRRREGRGYDDEEGKCGVGGGVGRRGGVGRE